MRINYAEHYKIDFKMIGLIVFLAVLVVALGIMQFAEDKKESSYSAEAALLKGRLEGMKESVAETTRQALAQLAPLTMETIADAVRGLGAAESEIRDQSIRFKLSDEDYFIDARTNPRIFLLCYYWVDPNDFDITLLKKAAHMMSDELIIVKALFSEEEGEDRLRLKFIVSAFERNYPSFRDNLKEYVTLIQDGNTRMREIYNDLDAQKESSPRVEDLSLPMP